MAKPWTRMQIMAAEDIMENAIVPAAEEDSEASPTAGRWREMFEGLAKRCQDGMSIITMDMVVAVGGKGGSSEMGTFLNRKVGLWVSVSHDLAAIPDASAYAGNTCLREHYIYRSYIIS